MLRALLLILATAFPGSLPASGQDSPATRPAGPRLRVMSYNIHHGRGTDDVVDLERIARVITAADPDLVSLQEVDVGVNRSGKIDEAAELARLTGMHVRFGKARDYDGGDYGQALLSRWPIKSFDVHELPGTAEQEQRIALVARLAPEEGLPAIRFVGTHLHHQAEAHRLAQSKRLLEILYEQKSPLTLITGDLNAEPGSRTMRRLLARYKDTTPDSALTYPAGEPIKKIDWILVNLEANVTVERSWVPDEPVASDHRPVVVDLVLPSP